MPDAAAKAARLHTAWLDATRRVGQNDTIAFNGRLRYAAQLADAPRYVFRQGLSPEERQSRSNQL